MNKTTTHLHRLCSKVPRHRPVLPQQHERGGAELVMRGLEVKQQAILDERHRRRIGVR